MLTAAAYASALAGGSSPANASNITQSPKTALTAGDSRHEGISRVRNLQERTTQQDGQEIRANIVLQKKKRASASAQQTQLAAFTANAPEGHAVHSIRARLSSGLSSNESSPLRMSDVDTSLNVSTASNTIDRMLDQVNEVHKSAMLSTPQLTQAQQSPFQPENRITVASYEQQLEEVTLMLSSALPSRHSWCDSGLIRHVKRRPGRL